MNTLKEEDNLLLSELLVGKIGSTVCVEAIPFYSSVQHSTYCSHYVDLIGKIDLGHLS